MVPSQPNPLPAAAAATAAAAAEETPLCNQDTSMYTNKLILAPMRMLALDYGADLVYSEELVDFKFMHCRRVENESLGTVDFVSKEHKVLFRTCAAERDRVVFQIGTSDPERALKVAQLVYKDVAAIDVNMGCPKAFSLQGGMGAALLRQKEKAVDILTTLVKNIPRPITCKIRILETLEGTLDLVRALTSTGISAIGVHARFTAERPRDSPHYDFVPEIVKISPVPVIANGASGDIRAYQDVLDLRNRCTTTSIMLARAAELNPSIFRKEGLISSSEVVQAYLKHAVRYDNYFENSKYVITSMQIETADHEKTVRTQSMADLCNVWGLGPYLAEVEAQRGFKQANGQSVRIEEKEEAAPAEESAAKRVKTDVTVVDVAINTKMLAKNANNSPRMVLQDYVRKSNLPTPVFDTQEDKESRNFKCILEVDGEKFTTKLWLKSKKHAEQASSAAFLVSKGFPPSDLSAAVEIPKPK